ncbi:MAG: hypothetical protein AAFX06_15070 [Planctomycetota bacterium]
MSESQPVDPSNTLEFTVESVDQWEAELDEFTADIRRRLSLVSIVADTSVPSLGEATETSQEEQVLDLLKSLSEQTRQ